MEVSWIVLFELRINRQQLNECASIQLKGYLSGFPSAEPNKNQGIDTHPKENYCVERLLLSCDQSRTLLP